MLGPQIFDWADRANNVFLARSYVFSFVARCDPQSGGRKAKGMRRAERAEGRGGGRLRSRERTAFLGCLPIKLLLLTTTSSDEM